MCVCVWKRNENHKKKKLNKQRMTLKITVTLAIVTHSHCASIDVCITVGIIFVCILFVECIVESNRRKENKTLQHSPHPIFFYWASSQIYFSSFFIPNNFQRNQQPKTIVQPWYTGAEVYTCGWTSGTIECSPNSARMYIPATIIYTGSMKWEPLNNRATGWHKILRLARVCNTKIKQTNQPLQWIWATNRKVK